MEKVAGGASNPADVLTREKVGARWLEAGFSWKREFVVVCGCEGICQHVCAIVEEFVHAGV